MPRRSWRNAEIEVHSHDIMIRNMVPGYAKLNDFFETVAKYVDCRFASRTQNSSTWSNQATTDVESDVSPRTKAKAKNVRKKEEYDSADQVMVFSRSDDSCDSVDLERMQFNAKLKQLSVLKEKLLERLNFKLEGGNERYIILAKYGKEALLLLFRKELVVISKQVLEADMDAMEGALYKLFCNVVPEHHYFGVSLPTIERNRYGLTSTQFIDYVILPDALYLDLMENDRITYEEAVSKICGEQRSRLTVYWHLVLRKVLKMHLLASNELCICQSQLCSVHSNILL